MEPFIPNDDSLLASLLLHYENEDETFHGEDHWQRVAWIGCRLSREVPEADPGVVYLFALFHDACRLTDGYDPDHGRRAARLARDLHGECYRISPEQLELLEAACAEHADGYVSRHPTIGACWDADRLDLWRVGLNPRSEFLSTAAARSNSLRRWSETLRERALDWEIVRKEFACAFGGRLGWGRGVRA